MRPLLVAVALLLAFPIAALVGAQVPPPPHTPSAQLVVDRVDVSGSPQWRDGVAGNASLVTVVVRNAGDAPANGYTLGYQWQGADGTLLPLRGDPTTSTDVDDQGPLSPGGTPHKHNVTWVVQQGEQGPGQILVTVTYGNQATSGTSPAFTIPFHRVTLSVPTTNLVLAAQETRFFRLGVQNSGNVAETVDLNATDWNRGANARLSTLFLPAHLTVPAGQQAVSDLLLAYPFVGDSGNFTANYTVQAVTGYNRLLAKTPLVFGRDSRNATGYAFTANNLAPEVLVGKGGSFRVSIQVGNAAPANSTLEDTYRIVPTFPAPLEGSVDAPRLALVGGESKVVNIDVNVSADAPLGTTYAIPIHVISDHKPLSPKPAALDQALQTRVQVVGAALAVHALHVDPNRLYVGDAAQATVEVANTGTLDYMDGSVVHAAVSLPGSAATTLNVTVPPPVRAGSSVLVSLPLGQLASAGAGTLAATWREAAGGGGSATVQVAFQARQYNVTLTAPLPLGGQPGEAVSYQGAGHSFQVSNHGTGSEVLRFAAFASKGQAKLAGFTQVTLDPGTQLSVPVVLVLPLPSGGLGNVTLSVAAAPPDRPDKLVTASVRTNITDVQPPRIQLPSLPAKWALGKALAIALRVDDDGRVASVAVAERLVPGNFTSHALHLDSDGHWAGTLTFLVPGDHAVRFSATDAAGNQAHTDPITVHVEDYAPPHVELLAPAPAAATRDTVLRFHISGGHALANLTARIEGENATVVALDNGEAALRLSDLPGLREGVQNVTVEAIDTVGASATLTVTVNVQDAVPQASATTTAAKHTPAVSAAVLLLGCLALAALGRRRHGCR